MNRTSGVRPWLGSSARSTGPRAGGRLRPPNWGGGGLPAGVGAGLSRSCRPGKPQQGVRRERTAHQRHPCWPPRSHPAPGPRTPGDALGSASRYCWARGHKCQAAGPLIHPETGRSSLAGGGPTGLPSDRLPLRLHAAVSDVTTSPLSSPPPKLPPWVATQCPGPRATTKPRAPAAGLQLPGRAAESV